MTSDISETPFPTGQYTLDVKDFGSVIDGSKIAIKEPQTAAAAPVPESLLGGVSPAEFRESMSSIPNGTIAEISEALIEEIEEKIKSDEGAAQLEEVLEEFSEIREELEKDKRIEETIEELRDDENIGIEIITVEDDGPGIFEAEDGTLIAVDLDDGEDFKVFEDEDGDTILAMDSELTEEEAVEITTIVAMDVIVETAGENGIILGDGFRESFVRTWMVGIFRVIGLQFNLGGLHDMVLEKMAALTGESDDDIVNDIIYQNRQSTEIGHRSERKERRDQAQHKRS